MATEKSPDAYRTISEAAAELELPAHVLRFWEAKFPQLKPVKRNGGRRFYRPGDLAFLRGVKRLLYENGYTIRGAQKLIRENGVAAVSAMGEGVSAPEPRLAERYAPAHAMPARASAVQSGGLTSRAADLIPRLEAAKKRLDDALADSG